MKRSTNNIDVKKTNRNRVFCYINNREQVCMPDIASALNISGPTVLTIVKELKEIGIIAEVGEFQSTGGRKAKAFAAVCDFKFAVGIEITRNHISLVLTNLSNEVLQHVRLRKVFSYDDLYLKELGDLVHSFIHKIDNVSGKIVGIGISVPAIVNQNKQFTSNSHALGVHHMECEEFAKYMDYPCTLINDANAAALSEIIRSETQKSMVYLSVSNTVGGAIVFNQEVDMHGNTDAQDSVTHNMFVGQNWHSAEFGHMVIRPGGDTCYCGKKGCFDAYCSALRLAEQQNGNLEKFFEELEAGDEQKRTVWHDYMENLAIAVDNLKMNFDCEVVIGGYVGNLFSPYLKELQEKVAEKNIFEKTGDYVRTCKYQMQASALGAAIHQMEQYIDSI